MTHPFAAWIKSVGLTQHDVAEAWGVKDAAIWKITGAGRTMGRDVALRIWRFTGGEVGLDQLLGVHSYKPENSAEHRMALRAIRAAQQRRESRRKERIDAKGKKKPKPRIEGGRIAAQ